MPRILPVLLAGGLLAAAPASALTLDFEDFGHGDLVADRVASHGDWTLVVDNPNRSFDLAAAFDTSVLGSADPDLEQGDGWAGGNLAPDTRLGNVLILQENDACSGGLCASPDDEGARPAGSFLFLFEDTFQIASIDLVDVDSATTENGRIRFFNVVDGVAQTTVAEFAFDELPGGGFGAGIVFGDNTANRIDFGQIGAFNAIEVELGGSGGIDNLVVVPEPTTLTLVSLGMAGLGLAGRRRSRA